MANHGSVGAKFSSVNLNKSYGQSSRNNYPPYGGSIGQTGASRSRPGSHVSSGGGMVVLSRNRPLQKAVPKLSVPSPLNLPSLRKEHEKLDLSGTGGGLTGGSGSGGGSRPSSSGMGWTKPVTVAMQEKGGSIDARGAESVLSNGDTKSADTYTRPSARVGGIGFGQHHAAALSPTHLVPVDVGPVLRGEDFPSLQAAMPISSGAVQKQRGSSFHKQKSLAPEESSFEQRDNFHSSSPIHVHPQWQSSPHARNGVNENGRHDHTSSGAGIDDQSQKQEDPLPLIRLNSRADWADDERDTGRGFVDRGKDYVFSNSESYWDRDLDIPRSSVVLPKAVKNSYQRWGQHGGETGKGSLPEVHKMDPYHKDISSPGREIPGSDSWRKIPLQKDGLGVLENINDASRSAGLNIYVPPYVGDSAQNSSVSGSRDSAFGRRDTMNGHHGVQHWNPNAESIRSQGGERHTRIQYGSEQSTSDRVDFQNFGVLKASVTSDSKGFSVNDALQNFGREKRPFSKSGLEDPYLKDFSSAGYSERDPFSGNLVGLVKRKKDVAKQADFHDPVRESFEAELERVQKMQEMERRRIVEEQERALERARREEEERQRLIKEEEEMRRRMEEEAHEAAWRAEQQRMEAIRQTEEQKIAREEEKRRIFVEEERRKQAAKQKLLELEARIAKREAELAKTDIMANTVAKDASTTAELDNWDESERMVESITTSATSDSSFLNRPFDVNSRLHPFREGHSSHPWKKDAFENGNYLSSLPHDQETFRYGPKQDAPRKEIYGEGGFMQSRAYFKGGVQDLHVDSLANGRERRWNPSGDGDHYNRNRDMESELYLDMGERYRDSSNYYSTYPERMYLNSDSDELYYGRSRYSMRQPRVLPPPSIAPVPRASVRAENNPSVPLPPLENDTHRDIDERVEESTAHARHYSSGQEMLEPSQLVNVLEEISKQTLDENATPRCDSQSSLSVSSPPTSPTHLSHDELDESAISAVVPAADEGEESKFSDDISGHEALLAMSNSIAMGEDEEWSLENDEEMQEQEEYDEDDDGYQEEDEVHEREDSNIDPAKEIENMHLEEKSLSDGMVNLVLGFKEGVEVGLPTDKFAKRAKSEESNIPEPKVSVDPLKEQGSGDVIQGDEQKLLQLIPNPEKSIQDLVTQALRASYSNGTIPVSVDSTSLSSSIPSILPTVSSVPCEADLPVKLQFGLFSGPSLIPSPVPAIQIGSIQMPLPLHSPIGSSVSHMHHPSQPPLFQFGQLKYTSPVSQGILPGAPQPISLIPPTIHTHYSVNQSSRGFLPIQHNNDAAVVNNKKDDISSLSLINHSGSVSVVPGLNYGHWSRDVHSFTERESVESNTLVHGNQTRDGSTTSKLGLHAEESRSQDTVVGSHVPSLESKDPKDQLHIALPQSFSSEKDSMLSKAPGPLLGNSGKKFAYCIRNSSSRSSILVSDTSRLEPSGFKGRPRRLVQRTEFRVRENGNKRQSLGSVSSNNLGLDDKPISNEKVVGHLTKNRSRRVPVTNKASRPIVECENSTTAPSSSQAVNSGNRVSRQTMTRSHSLLINENCNLRTEVSEEDVDAPLQSGIVRVFKQPGIEAPSDEDDFIEVRSKRQMLNDRREQREKEIKAKSRDEKVQRKTRSSAQGTGAATVASRHSGLVAAEPSNNMHYDVVSEGRGLVKKEVSTGFITVVSQQLGPVDFNAVSADPKKDIRSDSTNKSFQTGSRPAVEDLGLGITKDKGLDDNNTLLGAWGNAQIDQQVMTLTQTQLEEAMKPARFDSQVTSSLRECITSISEPILPPSSILTKENSIMSSSSPINSLLAGEKIQFGAVTSPTVIPSSSRVVSLGIGALGSFHPEIKILQNISKPKNDNTYLFEKDKHPNESCDLLEDCEAAAEAAASAVAVAAISTDEVVGNGLGSLSISDTKSFAGADVDITSSSGPTVNQQSGSQLRAEESLTVSLPADLSVETPPMSLWPPLRSPHNSSARMLSHFPGAPPSTIPFFDMNHHPMLGGPVLNFSQHEEFTNNQSQPQTSTVSGPGHIATWQQDSFYGPPAGFGGPFVSTPPGVIPGVQPHPHMVVYNHYTPVGQFGQVGLSFMGATTYIPSGKQPDWKLNPSTAAMGSGEGEGSGMNNMVSAKHSQRNVPPSPIQHIAPGSPFLPIASPVAMFDLPPFQAVPDTSVQARWSNAPLPPHHPLPMPISLPMLQQQQQQQTEVVAPVIPSQFSGSLGHHPIYQSLSTSRLSESSTTSTPSIATRTPFHVSADPTLGLVDSCSTPITPTPTPTNPLMDELHQSPSRSFGKSNLSSDSTRRASRNDKSTHDQDSGAVKTRQLSPQKTVSSSQQYSSYSFSNYGYHQQQRGGGTANKNGAGSEWTQRRVGFHHGRSQSLGAERSYPSSKVKQIYVAKQTSSLSSSVAE